MTPGLTLHYPDLPVWSHPNTGNLVQPTEADLVFIDGGHSVETVENDFDRLRGCKNILMDDYYTPCNRGLCPDVTKFGCNQLVEKVRHWVLPVRILLLEAVLSKSLRLAHLPLCSYPKQTYPKSRTNQWVASTKHPTS